MMKQKKGLLRIIEAFIAVTLIAGVLIVLYAQQAGNPKSSEELYRLQSSILNEIADNTKFREDVLNNNLVNIEPFVRDRVPAGFNYSIKICEVDEICSLDNYKKEIYASERVIAATLKEFKPMKIKIFMWRE